ncbi:MAG TPA: molybdopterin converting factor subunit 1 [Pseudogracilibacillus sp.]|nr:molybdopterin converting factor subunit 1 [Pseudogracilibacillus sp.]
MIEVLFFAQLQEEVGEKSLKIQANNLTVNDIITNHLQEYKINGLLNEAMVAVNEEYAQRDTMVDTGDVVAFIPPVSGG